MSGCVRSLWLLIGFTPSGPVSVWSNTSRACLYSLHSYWNIIQRKMKGGNNPALHGYIGRGQAGLMRIVLLWVMPQLKDRSLNLLSAVQQATTALRLPPHIIQEMQSEFYINCKLNYPTIKKHWICKCKMLWNLNAALQKLFSGIIKHWILS